VSAWRHPAMAVGLVTFCLVLGGLAVIALDHLRSTADAEVDRLRTAIETLAPQAGQLLAGSSAAADLQIRAWAAASGLRITLIAGDGRVHADSWTMPGLLDRMENHLGRPEVQAALRGDIGVSRRRSATTDRQTTYVARVVGPRPHPLGFLRLATESRPVPLPWSRLLVAVVAAAAAAALVRRSTRATQAAVSRHLRPWADLPEDAALEAMAEEAARRFDDARDTLTRELEATRAALEQLDDGVVLLSHAGDVQFANGAAVRLLGEDLVVDRPLVEGVRVPEVLALVRAVVESGDTRHTSVVVGGRELLVRGRAVARPLLSVALVLRDTSGERRLERARRALVADLAHELRTPLTVVGGLAEEMRLEGADHELLATLDRQVRRLAVFARELEELVRIESGQLQLDLEEVEVLGVARDVVADLRPAAEAARVEVHLEGAPATLRTDRVRLAQVLSNLVDNAVRYNRNGGEVRVVVESAATGVGVRVEDSGLGIPAADVPLVFQRFFRVRRGSNPEEGSGLGLAIVKHLVQALGGTVQLASREGEGTEVRVWFPLPPAAG
jgi:two-component system phosphate regulon sensor histidine kinase PhoR